VPLPGNHSRENRGINWLPIVRTALVCRFLVLLALSGAFIRYVNWSSERALAEFMSAGEPSQPAPAISRNPQRRSRRQRQSALRAEDLRGDRRRHARPCAGHPRLNGLASEKTWMAGQARP